MWAFRLCAPGTFEKVTAPAPDPARLKDGQVLIRVLAGGLCGSDFTFFKGVRNPAVPMENEASYAASPYGASLHEVAGEVVVTRDPALREGSTVVGWATGMDGLAEYAVTDGISLAEYDDTLAPAEPASLYQLTDHPALVRYPAFAARWSIY